ncbi:hypothetical protein R9X49_14520 [Pectobacterium carotovorum]|uniref:hypothetical protein n=1 Tax=Pectobacterium carotovorum TaxID=554 RepID=UPI0029DBE25F|nr:hypothetical protein [Pectobacterium carotovorum]MDX6916319.1 hypothetical protein [Pectobacterium carotovorum]
MLFEKNISRWKPMKEVNSREFKALLRPDFFEGSREEGYKIVWERIKQASLAHGFGVEDVSDPFSETHKIKEYFDTEDLALRKRGLLIRQNSKVIDGSVVYPASLTAKELGRNTYRVLGTRLDFAEGITGKSEVEEKIALNDEGTLDGYVEIKRKIYLSQPREATTLRYFSDIFPELKHVRMDIDTELTSYRMHSHRIYPGAIILTDKRRITFDIEACLYEGETSPFVVGCSYTLDTPKYHDMNKSHKKAEDFLCSVIEGACKDLIYPGAGRWLGSKLSMMLEKNTNQILGFENV